ncbi:NAD(P)-dependent oxidoreductase [Bordetella bronchiseptica]|uniref:NAD(P)-dependent oxidoreductase n=3 Tax=Bordetella bronchiseptica TaxID=518 RepID=UPI00045A1030|nr:NAD(P)-dependent oxidoreductase [Bordetella bronchiseptica]AUL15877.1 2-hydroxy-3-oxopropionate reductase [Bordetella bronchiseptica]AWP58981.1 2-hydroxy-3-oxopropionate reductase [Bordetella bronchiseptica]KAK53029.1 NADP oxidoreductase coenzyme F420-dependent [Bordetella bronchiseptica OSU054]KAK78196.1 NADP oxidoreductase coenzyme F420-dependent [Bordetella bronchiseptica CA90 BB02]KDB71858.1 NADP oxidoreductase coenzyme F420-dependent [Bordetella bronchiseptica CA90 BB1334]
MSATLAFCGAGLMGAPMIRRLLAAGHRVRVWNRSAAKAQALAADGAVVCATPAEAAAGAQAVLLCLTDLAAVQATLFGPHGVAEVAGGLLVDHSSIEPDATRALAARLLEASGRVWIDAPVSGGVAGAQAGTLSILAGGPAAAIEAARPWLRAYAGRVTRLGDTGAGQIGKLCNQTIVATTVNAIAEAVALARHNGIDAAALDTALAGGWADSVLLRIFVPRMTAPVDQPLGALQTMLKDLENVAALAAASGTQLRGLQGVLDSYRTAAARGLGPGDLSDIVRVAWPERPAAPAREPA